MLRDPETQGGPAVGAGYRPGACNIGPAEIARRRRGAVAGTILTAAVYVGLVALSAGSAPALPRAARLIVALPAVGAIVAWLQVALRFCVNFGSRGVANFGPTGRVTRIEDPVARRADRARVARMLVASAVGAVLIGLLAFLGP